MVANHLVLKVPNASDEQAVMEYRDEFLGSQSVIHGGGSLETFDTYDAWLDKVALDYDSPEEGRVAATQYLAFNKANHLVGMIQLRHDLNDYLRSFGGHIGYSVRPSERRKGYASRMLGLCLKEAYALDLDRVLITCDEDNIGSRRVIEKAGGVLEDAIANPTTGKRTLRFWVVLSPSDTLKEVQAS